MLTPVSYVSLGDDFLMLLMLFDLHDAVSTSHRKGNSSTGDEPKNGSGKIEGFNQEPGE